MNLPRSQVIPKVWRRPPLANLWRSLFKPLEPSPWPTSGSGSQLRRMGLKRIGMTRMGVRSGSHVVQSGLIMVPWPSPVCKSSMQGATAVLFATMLVPSSQNLLSLALVRIDCAPIVRNNCTHVFDMSLTVCSSPAITSEEQARRLRMTQAGDKEEVAVSGKSHRRKQKKKIKKISSRYSKLSVSLCQSGW